MSIIAYRQAIIDKLKSSFPTVLQDVQAFPGKFGLDDIDRLCMNTPAAFVAVLSAPGNDLISTGEVLFNVCACVFIATRSDVDNSADVQGWTLAETIATLASYNYFDSAVLPSGDIEIENLWSRDQDSNSMCIMGVSWITKIKLGNDFAAELLKIQRDSTATFVYDETKTKVNFHVHIGAKSIDALSEHGPPPGVQEGVHLNHGEPDPEQ